MIDSTFCDPSVRFVEEMICVSDGVSLKVIDFQPDDDDPEKPVVVFVAGWISLISGWKGFLADLTRVCRTLYVETREKKSALLPAGKKVDFTIGRMAEDLREIVARKIPSDRRFYFSGSSLGATVVLDYMTKTENRQPKSALLISPICDFPFPPWLVFIIRFVPARLYTAVRPILKWYLKYIRLDRKNEPEQVAKYAGTIDAAEPVRLKANAYAIKDYSLWDKLTLVAAPTVIIGAETDTLHGIEILEKIVARIPSAKLVLMASNKETHSAKAGALIAREIAASQNGVLLA